MYKRKGNEESTRQKYHRQCFSIFAFLKMDEIFSISSGIFKRNIFDYLIGANNFHYLLK